MFQFAHQHCFFDNLIQGQLKGANITDSRDVYFFQVSAIRGIELTDSRYPTILLSSRNCQVRVKTVFGKIYHLFSSVTYSFFFWINYQYIVTTSDVSFKFAVLMLFECMFSLGLFTCTSLRDSYASFYVNSFTVINILMDCSQWKIQVFFVFSFFFFLLEISVYACCNYLNI